MGSKYEHACSTAKKLSPTSLHVLLLRTHSPAVLLKLKDRQASSFRQWAAHRIVLWTEIVFMSCPVRHLLVIGVPPASRDSEN